jgi:hypothetical protein
MLSDFVAHFMLKKIGARGSRQEEIKFLAPKIYLLANTHTLTQYPILQITLHQNVHTHAQGYSRSLRSQTSRFSVSRSTLGRVYEYSTCLSTAFSLFCKISRFSCSFSTLEMHVLTHQRTVE